MSIYYDPSDMLIVNTYCEYYICILRQCIHPDMNIICGNKEYDGNAIRIEFNYEHTLVKQGGRDSYGAIEGKILSDKVPYLVRIDRYDILNKADIIIDYSIPNIINVASSGLYNEFAKKMIYISPSIFSSTSAKEDQEGPRSIDILTTFINTDQARRAELIRRLQPLPHVNRNDCFEKEALRALYKNTKILINIHQTDHHHTFEELRVLPALECGVIVISEISPLHTHIPYHDYVIWETYDGIIDKVKDILNNYDKYYDMIFNTPKMVKLEELHDANVARLSSAVLSASNTQM